jgi:hypothetical protein
MCLTSSFLYFLQPEKDEIRKEKEEALRREKESFAYNLPLRGEFL